MDISYNISKTNIENIEDVKFNFSKLINRYILEVGEVDLNNIFITDSICEDVKIFQQKHNLIVAVSENCAGKFISYMENTEYKGVIFYDWKVLYAITNLEIKTFYRSVVFHELLHAYENNKTSSLLDFNCFNEEGYKKNSKNLNYNLNLICDIIWSEYYAIRMTAQHFNLYETNLTVINTWLDILNNKFKNQLRLMNGYTISEKYAFFNGIIENTSEFFKVFSYVCGNSYDSTNNTFYEETTILESRFGYLFEQVNKEFKRLFELYPNWNGLEEYNNLKNIIIKFWKRYGVEISQNQEDLFIIVNMF